MIEVLAAKNGWLGRRLTGCKRGAAGAGGTAQQRITSVLLSAHDRRAAGRRSKDSFY